MSRHGYARRAYRREWRRWIVVNKIMVIPLSVLFMAVAIFEAWLLNGYWAGMVHGVLATSFLAMLGMGFLAASGSMPRVTGAWGEDNTRDVLKWAKRRRLIYGWVDYLEVQGGDVDHLVAASSGWVAIDSKWHSRTYDHAQIAQDADRASRSARRASLVLRSLNHTADVQPVAACWGGTRHEIPGGHAAMHGVDFVSGTHLKAWLRTLRNEASLDRRTARAVLADLRRFRRRVRPLDVSSPGRDTPMIGRSHREGR